jgi:excisionase family DNA binding protein
MGILEEIKEQLNNLEDKLDNMELEPKEQTKEVLNVEETAEYLGMAPSSVYNLINQGKLRYIQVHGRKLIKHEHIEEMLDRHTKKKMRNKGLEVS